MSCDTNFPTIYNLPFATVQVGKAGTLALISLNFSGQKQQKAVFSLSQLVINSQQEATGVFQQKLFMSCYFQQRCSLLWTLLCLAYTTVAKSRPVNTVTTPHSASERAAVAWQRQLCLPSPGASDITDVFRCSQGVYNKSCI